MDRKIGHLEKNKNNYFFIKNTYIYKIKKVLKF